MFPRNTTHDPIGYWYSKIYRMQNPDFGIFEKNVVDFDAEEVYRDFNVTISKKDQNGFDVKVPIKWTLKLKQTI